MHFDLVDLRLMVRVAEYNSLTRGAEASFLSLPAASTRIKNLEESVGARLFNRTSQGVTLTPPGQAFVLHARTVLGQIEGLKGEMQEYAKGIKGHLRVFANTTAVTDFLPDILPTYLAAHPKINIDLQEKPNGEIARGVRESRADIGIGIHRHRLDAQPATGADHAAGDLATVGDQQRFEHGVSVSRKQAGQMLRAHIRNTGVCPSKRGVLASANSRQMPKTSRVCAGSIRPSSHRRAVA